jgi:hypothetical protein
MGTITTSPREDKILCPDAFSGNEIKNKPTTTAPILKKRMAQVNFLIIFRIIHVFVQLNVALYVKEREKLQK